MFFYYIRNSKASLIFVQSCKADLESKNPLINQGVQKILSMEDEKDIFGFWCRDLNPRRESAYIFSTGTAYRAPVSAYAPIPRYGALSDFFHPNRSNGYVSIASFIIPIAIQKSF